MRVYPKTRGLTMKIAIEVFLALIFLAISFFIFFIYGMHWPYVILLILWGASEIAYKRIKSKI